MVKLKTWIICDGIKQSHCSNTNMATPLAAGEMDILNTHIHTCTHTHTPCTHMCVHASVCMHTCKVVCINPSTCTHTHTHPSHTHSRAQHTKKLNKTYSKFCNHGCDLPKVSSLHGVCQFPNAVHLQWWGRRQMLKYWRHPTG